jgi:hypothetical protein
LGAWWFIVEDHSAGERLERGPGEGSLRLPVSFGEVRKKSKHCARDRHPAVCEMHAAGKSQPRSRAGTNTERR